MNDEMAKRIIRAYQFGLSDLSSYVQAIEYCAEKYPEMTLVDVNNWAEDSGGIYICDPEKNVECTKTGCYINDGPCHLTLNKGFEKEGVIL